MQPGERKLHLRLDATDCEHSEAALEGSVGRGVQEARLPDPGLAPQHDGRSAFVDLVQQGVEDLALAIAPEKSWRFHVGLSVGPDGSSVTRLMASPEARAGRDRRAS